MNLYSILLGVLCYLSATYIQYPKFRYSELVTGVKQYSNSTLVIINY